MNKKLLFSLALGAASACLYADDPTPALNGAGVANNTTVQTQLRLDIKDATKDVHFIQGNNDPDVFTKVYILKNADPYELRPYIVNAIGGDQFGAGLTGTSGNANSGRRINSNATKVECIKYADGTGMLIVSAEAYRFDNTEVGMNLDKVIEILDQPKIASASGHIYTLYFPKYWDAASLKTILDRVGGLTTANDPYQLTAGKDSVETDNTLNALLFYTPAYSVKNFQAMLEQYDSPTSEAIINYTVYEIDSENDTQVGNDFQAWKNGPGTDILAVGSQYSNGWDVTNMTTARPYVNNSRTRYFSFSPKWNTKYLDFLAVKGKAQVVTSGSISIMNNCDGRVNQSVSFVSYKDGAARGNNGNGGIISQSYGSTTGIPGPNPGGSFTFTGTTAGGVTVNDTGLRAADGSIGTVNFTVTKTVTAYSNATGTNGNTLSETYYTLQTSNAGATKEMYFYDTNGKNLGQRITLYSTDASFTGIAFNDSTNTLPIQKAVTRASTVNNSGFGFDMTLTPIVCDEATTLKVDMTNTNLIGFSSNGDVRTSTTNVKTKVSVNNKGEKFVIGGLNKESVVRAKSSVPYLGTIPVLGWAFTSEREIHKKSQLVAVIECIPVKPETQVPASAMAEIAADKEKISNYGVKVGPFDQNDLGFDQYLLDSDKKGIDPLP